MNTGQLLLLLLLVVLVVVVVFLVIRRLSVKRDAQRVEAAGLRSEAEHLAATMAGQAAFAEQAAERAEVARAEADARAREAERLEAEAADHAATVEATREEYDVTLRRADEVDPDVKGSDAVAPEPAEDAGPAEVAEPAAASASAVASSAPVAAGGQDPSSERIASAVDFRDDVPDGSAEPDSPHDIHEMGETGEARDEHAGVYGTPNPGSGSDMSDETSTETAERRPLEESEDAVAPPVADADQVGDDRAAAAEGEAAGEGAGAGEGAAAAMTVIAEPEAYAATEPVLAEDSTPPVAPTPDESGEHGKPADQPTAPDESGEHGEPADQPTAPDEAGSTDQVDDGEGSSAHDWAADEGALLTETSERGDRLEAERAELADQARGVDPDEVSGTASDDASGTASDEGTGADPEEGTGTASEAPTTASPGRRVSAFDELRDGGFGVGSAAPLHDGAQPLDHPVQAYRDTMTYRAPGAQGYDSAEPDVWFYDEGAAERSGFRPADG